MQNVIPPYSKLMVHINKPSVTGSNFAVRKRASDRVDGFNTKPVTGEDVDTCAGIKKPGKFTYDPDALIYVSTKRVREWGILKNNLTFS